MPLRLSLLRFAVAVTTATLAVTPAAAQTLDAATRTVSVAPSGGDDTQAIATAFAMCQDVGPGCTVRLTAGTFLTRQQELDGFVGSFVGAGREATVVEALTPLVVSPARVDIWERSPDRGGAPVLFTFRDSDVTMRDVTLAIRGAAPVTPWSVGGMELDAVAVAVWFAGERVRGVFERVAIEGERTAGEFGANVLNGVYLLPELLDAGTTLTADFVFRDGSVSGVVWGLAFGELVRSSVHVVGSRVDAIGPVEFADAEGSTILVLGNHLTTTGGTGVAVAVRKLTDLSTPTHVWITHNEFVVRGADGSGVSIDDPSASGAAIVHVTGNRFDLQDALAGVRGPSHGTVVTRNTFVGAGGAAIQAGGEGVGAAWLVADNDVAGLVTTGKPIIVMAGFQRAFVVCTGAGQLDDEGTDTVDMCP
jgi:hypothetical protein